MNSFPFKDKHIQVSHILFFQEFTLSILFPDPLMWVKVTQSCPTICDPMDCSPPSSSVRGILQARILKWVAISFSRRSSPPRDWTWVSCLAGRFFTSWATRETPSYKPLFLIVTAMCLLKKKNTTFNFVLECSQITMLWWFQVVHKGTQPYIYMYPFASKLLSHPGCQ